MLKIIPIKGILSFIAVLFFIVSSSTAADSYSFRTLGKSYEIVKDFLSWENAAELALERGGYLVQIGSQEEQQAIFDTIVNGAKISPTYVQVLDGGGIAYLWIGASDINQEGKWVWSSNLEETGVNFWNGKGAAGSVVGSNYVNWGGKTYGVFNEPDDSQNLQDAAAIALEPWPKGTGTLGSTGEWNDIRKGNKIYFIIEYDFTSVPEKCSLPVGPTTVCPNTVESEYTSSSVDAVTYNWTLNPTNAGTITVTDNKAKVKWTTSFLGEVSVSCKGVNPIGEGLSSDQLTITKESLPATPEILSGEAEVCNNVVQSTYTISAVEKAVSYNWSLSPQEAGTIEPNDLEAVVTWNDQFKGNSSISISSTGFCGNSTPKVFSIKVNGAPNKPTKPEGSNLVFNTELSTQYSVNQLQDASTYNWEIVPANAGTIESNQATVTLTWDPTFLGNVALAVSAENDCGVGEKSSVLNITRTDDTSVEDEISFMNIYPNPSNGNINLNFNEFGTYYIKITDLLGKTVFSSEVTDKATNIDINSKGLFIINVERNGVSSSRLLIVN